MSRTNPSICCSRCGRIIYEPLTDNELRQKKYARHISDYYAVNEDGREDELCEKCYMVWKEQDETRKRIKASPDMAIDIMRKYQKIQEIYKKYLNDMVTNIYADEKFIVALRGILEDGNEN